jgi:nicotinate phosphoribosyltransferase
MFNNRYDTLRSGIPNFLAVALALEKAGKRAIGIRLDSGDIAYLSRCARQMFARTANAFKMPKLTSAFSIVASNNINEDVINSLNEQGHEVDAFMIGTHLVTCQKQPSLGMVYKLTELDGNPRMKLSQDLGKLTIPGSKEVYRLIGKDDVPLLDMIIRRGEAPPMAGRRILAQHPFDGKKRVFVTPKMSIPLLIVVWDGSKIETDGECGIRIKFSSLEKLRKFRDNQVSIMREDHLRCLNATPYKVSVSSSLYTFLHDLWNRVVPIPELS